ncbi:MAG TPA: hypothetical protein VGN72_20800 [Tepidisphaeraceae bacterium]|jgi:hypothetical protein|nr:hypothetical protein [Tepidisphaeraceae bacterium]
MPDELDVKAAIEHLAGVARPIRLGYATLLDKWFPDAPPNTLVFSTIGRSFSSASTELHNGEVAAMWCTVEHLLSKGNEEVKNAVATGLIEAVLDEISAGRLDASVIVNHLGPRTKAYCRAWDQFTGFKTEGLGEGPR